MGMHVRSRETSAAPERVWQIWSDPSTWPEWNPDVESVVLEGPFATGTTGRMRTRSGGQHQITLESVEPGHGFQLVTAAVPGSRFAFRCEVAPGPSGGSRISQAVSMRGPLGPLFSMLMGEKIAESFGPLLSGLARKAESSTGGA